MKKKKIENNPVSKLFKPCCKKYPELARIYSDMMADLDRPMRNFSLLLQCAEGEGCSEVDLRHVGDFIEDYLNQKVIIENYVLGRPLRTCTASDPDISAELCRITLKLREAGWFGKRKDET